MTGVIPTTLQWLGYFGWQDIINCAFATTAAFCWFGNVAQAWRDEEIKGMRPGVLILYVGWGAYCVPFMILHQSPLSAIGFSLLTLANLFYAFSYWLFVGNFNYDKRSHRARWWFLSRIKRTVAPCDLADIVLAQRAPLPTKECRVCGFETRHDLDGHCMICDVHNGG